MGEGPETPDDPPAGTLFIVLWDTMADIVGSAATATLLRRAIQRVAPHYPILADLRIGQNGLLYGYELPLRWQDDHNEEILAALRALTRELYPLLIEMTGLVVVRRLASVPALDPLAFDV